jgi:hypothetical protein
MQTPDVKRRFLLPSCPDLSDWPQLESIYTPEVSECSLGSGMPLYMCFTIIIYCILRLQKLNPVEDGSVRSSFPVLKVWSLNM